MEETFINDILDDGSKVLGEIYVITNLNNNKQYVGQTLTHRLNHSKYRPFGSNGRFNDHISEALCNSKAKQCTYLNNAIRKHGRDAFKVEMIERCPRQELDGREQTFIHNYNCLFPNGYNLTRGGKTLWKVDFKNTSDTTESIKQPRNQKKQESTKQLISSRLKERFEKNPDLKEQRMLRTKQQHEASKLKKFEGLSIDDDMEKYIHPVINQETQTVRFYRVKVGDVVTKFHGKHSSAEQLKKDALEFLQKLKNKT
jgi:group I intron endonuclease